MFGFGHPPEYTASEAREIALRNQKGAKAAEDSIYLKRAEWARKNLNKLVAKANKRIGQAIYTGGQKTVIYEVDGSRINPDRVPAEMLLLQKYYEGLGYIAEPRNYNQRWNLWITWAYNRMPE